MTAARTPPVARPAAAEARTRTRCPACGERRARAGFAVRGHRFRSCRACATLFLARTPAAEELSSLYRVGAYFARGERDTAGPGLCGYADYLADRLHIEAKFDRVLARFERHLSAGALLDVGCGPGLLLAVAERRGWLARGVDPNPWAVAHARERLGVEATVGELPGLCPRPADRFDAITLMDVIEHVDDPGALLDEARGLVRPGGVVAVLTPDAGALASRALGRRWPEARRAPGHQVLFSAGGLRRLLERYGFEVLEQHSVGKTSTISTLLADAEPIAPPLVRPLGRALGARAGRRVVAVDPRTKVCVYARYAARSRLR